MNHPDKERFEKIEQRLDRLEQQTEPIKINRIEIDTGGIQGQLAETNKLLRGIAQTQPDHGEKLDTLERGQQEIRQDIKAIHEVFVGDFNRIEDSLGEFKATVSERFDRNERVQAEHGELLKQILARLPKSGDEQPPLSDG